MAVFQNSLLPATGAAAAADAVVERSLRFNDDNSAYLTRTFGSAGDQTTWTFSCWLKRATLGAYQNVFRTGEGNDTALQFYDDDTLNFYVYDGSYRANLITTQVFRDAGTWYHLVVTYDSTPATPGVNDVSIYVNGEQVTAFSTATYPSQDTPSGWNSAGVHYIGAEHDGGMFYQDGLFADVYALDGTKKVASDFAEENDSGLWVPKTTSFSSGDYGTNGFHLDFIGGHDSSFLLQSDHPDGSTNFEDSSGAGHNAITVNGSGVSHQDTVGNPFDGSGSAIYFGGSGDLTTPTHADFAYGTGNFTIEGWVYPVTNTGTYHGLFGNYVPSDGSTWGPFLEIVSEDWGVYDGTTHNSTGVSVVTDQWHHLALVRSGTGDTDSKCYLNGSLIWTSASALDDFSSATYQSIIGEIDDSGSYYFNGYLYDIRITKGEARYTEAFTAPTAAFESTAVIHPGGDSSGKRNHWDVVNIGMGDVVGGSPEADDNFATLNPLDSHSAVTLSQANLTGACSTSWAITKGTIFVDSGQWYAEVYRNAWSSTDGNNTQIGIIDSDRAHESTGIGDTVGGGGWHIHQHGTATGYRGDGGTNRDFDCALCTGGYVFGGAHSSPVAGDVIGMALDLDTSPPTLKYYLNGSLYFDSSADDPSVTSVIAADKFYTFAFSMAAPTSAKLSINFGQDGSFAGEHTGTLVTGGGGEWAYAPPTADPPYLALKTANLPGEDVDVSDHYKAVKYTGTGAADNNVTGVGFEPSLVWIKPTGSGHHSMFDSVRGATKYIIPSNYSSSQETDADSLTSFDSDGFTVGAATAPVNANTTEYIAWCLKTTSSGSGYKANTTAGWSIVSYTGTGVSRTVTHQCGATPGMIIVKSISGDTTNDNFMVHHKDLTDTKYLFFDDTNSENADSPYSSVGATTFTLNDDERVNEDGENYIAYCFTPTPICSIGTYAGNNDSDGPFVYTGNSVDFLITKSISTGGSATYGWGLFDSTRQSYNIQRSMLEVQSDAAEDTSQYADVDLLSNGFKPRYSMNQYNGSNTYVYMAIGQPTRNATGR